MADFNKFYPILTLTEGPMGADPRDVTPARFPSKYIMQTGQFKGYPVHTVKGITYQTFIANAKKVGLPATTEAFIGLTYEQGRKFYKTLFWDVDNMDKINRQGVAEILVDSKIGSIAKFRYVVREMQKFMKQIGVPVKYTGKLDAQTIAAINYVPPIYGNAKYEQWLINFLSDKRLEFFKKLKNWNVYGKGWTSRVEAARTRGFANIA
jgi:lysozyme family protein